MPTTQIIDDSLRPYALQLLFHSACLNGQLNLLEALLTKSIKLDSVSEETTALHKAADGNHKAVVIKLLNAGATIDQYSLNYLIASRELKLAIKPVIQQQQTTLLQQEPLAKRFAIKSTIVMALCNKLFVDPILDVHTLPGELSHCYHEEQQCYTPLIQFAAWGALNLHNNGAFNYNPLRILIGRGTSISHIFHPPTSARGRYHENTIYIAGDIGERERVGTLLHEMIHFAVDHCPPAKQFIESLDQTSLTTEINTAASRHHLRVYSLQEVYQTHSYDPDHIVEELIARVPQLLYLAKISNNFPKVQKHLPLLLGSYRIITQTLSLHLTEHAPGIFSTPPREVPTQPTIARSTTETCIPNTL